MIALVVADVKDLVILPLGREGGDAQDGDLGGALGDTGNGATAGQLNHVGPVRELVGSGGRNGGNLRAGQMLPVVDLNGSAGGDVAVRGIRGIEVHVVEASRPYREQREGTTVIDEVEDRRLVGVFRRRGIGRGGPALEVVAGTREDVGGELARDAIGELQVIHRSGGVIGAGAEAHQIFERLPLRKQGDRRVLDRINAIDELVDGSAQQELGIQERVARAIGRSVPSHELVTGTRHGRRARLRVAGDGGQAQLRAIGRRYGTGRVLARIRVDIKGDVEGVGPEGRDEGERSGPAGHAIGTRRGEAGVGGNDLARRGIDPLDELVPAQGCGCGSGGTAHAHDRERPAELRARPAGNHLALAVDELDEVIGRDVATPGHVGHAIGNGVGNGLDATGHGRGGEDDGRLELGPLGIERDDASIAALEVVDARAGPILGAGAIGLGVPAGKAIAIAEDAIEGAANGKLQVDAIGGAIIGKGAKATILVVLDRIGVGGKVRGEGGGMEGAVIVDDTEDGVAIENIAASQGAIDGVGPAVKVVAGGRRGDGALDVEATGRVDVEVDDFGCGLAVIGGGG